MNRNTALAAGSVAALGGYVLLRRGSASGATDSGGSGSGDSTDDSMLSPGDSESDSGGSTSDGADSGETVPAPEETDSGGSTSDGSDSPSSAPISVEPALSNVITKTYKIVDYSLEQVLQPELSPQGAFANLQLPPGSSLGTVTVKKMAPHPFMSHPDELRAQLVQPDGRDAPYFDMAVPGTSWYDADVGERFTVEIRVPTDSTRVIGQVTLDESGMLTDATEGWDADKIIPGPATWKLGLFDQTDTMASAELDAHVKMPVLP